MNTILQKISDVGCKNPIIARLSNQTSDLIRLFPLTEKQEKDIQVLLGNDVELKLVKCDKIHNQIKDKIGEINKTEYKEKLQGTSIEVPYIVGLEKECENFLYQAKLALRDLSKIFNIFYEVEFCGRVYKGSNFEVYADWACDFFGANDDFGKRIKEDLHWIKRIKDMRDAVEHPKETKKLIINNIKLISRTEPPFFREPKWQLTGQKETSIIVDMKTILEDILSFSEDLLVSLLDKIKGDRPIIFREIPEEEREKTCPIRIKIDIDPNKLQLPNLNNCD